MRDMERVMQVRIILIATTLTMTLGAETSRAQSWSGEVSWPTFYRVGPGRNYTVIDELDRGVSLDVLSCSSGWCKVRDDDSIGFVEQKWIQERNAMPPKPQQTVEADCVQARITGSGYKGGLEYLFCSRATPVSASSGQPSQDVSKPSAGSGNLSLPKK
jgi:hypothetical protein